MKKQNSPISLSKSLFKPFVLFGISIPENLKLENKLPNCEYLGIIKNNKNIGNIVIWKQSKRNYWIDQIKIDQKFQNKGYGSIAINLLIKKYPKVNFSVSGVIKAKNYYLKNGFKIIKYDYERQYIDFEYTR